MKVTTDLYTNKVSDILKLAQQKGASQAEVALSSGEGFSLSVRNGTVETIENQKDQGLAITVYFGQKKGSADTGDLAEQSILETLDAACTIAKFTLEDPYAGLPEKELLATTWPEIDVDHPYTGTIDSATQLARQCEEIGLSYDKRINNSEGANFSTYRGLNVYGNTLGFLAETRATDHSLSLSLIAEDQGHKERDFSFTHARDFNDLWSAKMVATEAAESTLKRLNPRKLSTQKAPVIFASHLASGLIRHYLRAISGSSLYRKTSFLLNSLGMQVFPQFLTFFEDPFIKKGIGSALFDGEGVAIHAQNLVENGRVATYLLNCYTARQLKMKTTGHAGGTRNIFVQSEYAPSFDTLLTEMGTGLLVTELIGQGVNPVTGDYSRGASGLWVENGKVQYPVSEITIAGNLRDMYQNIRAIATDIEQRDRIKVGSILIDGMTIAGD